MRLGQQGSNHFAAAVMVHSGSNGEFIRFDTLAQHEGHCRFVLLEGRRLPPHVWPSKECAPVPVAGRERPAPGPAGAVGKAEPQLAVSH